MGPQTTVNRSNGKEAGDFGSLHSAGAGKGAGHLEQDCHDG